MVGRYLPLRSTARTSVRLAALAVVLAAAAFTAAVPGAFAHEEAATTVQGHFEEDAVLLTPAMERSFERHTRAATAADAARAAARVTGNEGQVGQWGPVVAWPVVGIHAALLPNGKVLAYDATSNGVHDNTRATVWDPATGAQTPVNVNTGFNIFCSGLAHLMDGSVFIAGGNKNDQADGIAQTHIFDSKTNTWSLGPTMATERWYPTVTPLNDGEMLITDGTDDVPDTPEVRMTNGSLRALPSAALDLPLYPWMDVAPDGDAFYSGPDPTMRSLDPAGNGSWQTFGQRDSINRDYGSHALYDIGKILVAGGGPSSKDARVINLNGSSPQVSATSSMAYGRRQHNLTVLADGTVLATGGNSSGSPYVDLSNGVYAAEQWNPATGQWKTLASMQVTRQYHSTALLLPDGRVLSAGGGICSVCNQVGYLNMNAEVFSPPYLFKNDGSGQLAPRPQITAAPGSVSYNESFGISTPDAASINKAALVRLGAVTHSVNMEQRYVPLSFDHENDGALRATAPANANIAPPGVYMLFLIDANGVPSVARMVRVDATTSPPDTTPPDTSIDSGPNGPTNDATPTFGFSSSEYGSTYQCKVDGGSFASCSSPKTLATLPDGNHTFMVRATDPAGNTDQSPATRSFSVDATAPDTSIDSGPSGQTNDSTPTFEFSSADANASFQCKIDGGSFASCSSPKTLSALADGNHTFTVRATDPVGNTDQTPATRSFNVNTDTTAPDTTISSGPSGPTNDSTPAFEFSSNESGATFACKVDGAGYSSCSSPKTLSALADGNHTFTVRATDPAGNTDASPATRTFKVDTTAPDTSIDSGPLGVTADPTPTFTFSGEAGSSFECRLDGEPFGACSGPGNSETAATLPDGAHTFEVRAIDAAANADPTPASRAFVVDTTVPPDTTAPDTAITGAPKSRVKTRRKKVTVAVSFRSEPGAAFSCKLDSSRYRPCTSPYEVEVNSGGKGGKGKRHAIAIRATDAAGNVGRPAITEFEVIRKR